jgi:phage-related protein
MNWQIETYKTSGGQEVVEEFIYKMQAPTQAKLWRLLDMLERFGPELGMPHTRAMGGGLYELRVRGKQEVRVFYVFAKGHTVYLLHAFQKKTQATPKKELDVARRRQAEAGKL